MSPLVEARTLNTGDAEGETKSLTDMHRVDLPPYSRYVVLDAHDYEALTGVVASLAELSLSTRGMPLRAGSLRDLVRDARALTVEEES